MRPVTFSLQESARATQLAAPTPPVQHEVAAVSQQPMRAEDLSPTARLLKIKQEERERSAQALEPSRAAPPLEERPRPPVETPARAEELSLSARLQKIKDEEAKRQASKPVAEPPRAMSMTERLRQAKGIQGAPATPAQQRNQERER